MCKYSGHKNYRSPLVLPKGFSNMSANHTKQIQVARINELKEELILEKYRAGIWQKIVEVAEEELELNIKENLCRAILRVKEQMPLEK